MDMSQGNATSTKIKNMKKSECRISNVEQGIMNEKTESMNFSLQNSIFDVRYSTFVF